MSAANTGTPCAESCSASSCRVLVLPVPVAPGDQAVPVEHAERDPHGHVGEVVGVEHQPAELERRPLERVAGGPLDDGSAAVGALTGVGRAHRWHAAGHGPRTASGPRAATYAVPA